MHQQYWTKLAEANEPSGAGAMSVERVGTDPIVAHLGSLAKLTRALAARQINLQAIGGKGIETGGTLLLGVHDADKERFERAMTELGYKFGVFEPTFADLEDRPGQVAAFAQKIADDGRLIDTILIGAPNGEDSHARVGRHENVDGHEHKPGTIPIQATTIRVSPPSKPAQ